MNKQDGMRDKRVLEERYLGILSLKNRIGLRGENRTGKRGGGVSYLAIERSGVYVCLGGGMEGGRGRGSA